MKQRVDDGFLPNKSMRQTRPEFPWIQTLGKGIKRLWILSEILQRKHGFRVREFQCGEVTVQASARGTEVGNATVCADSCADAEDYLLGCCGADISQVSECSFKISKKEAVSRDRRIGDMDMSS